MNFKKKLAQIETSKIVTILGICLMSCIILYTGITSADYFTEQNWTIDNDTGLVWFEDDRAFLSAFPHNITSSQWVYFNVTSKQFSGDVDAVWGFNGENAKPKSAELYKPHYVNWTTEHSQTFLDVSDNSPSNEPCDYGNEYNINKTSITYQICIEHDENGCVDYDTTSSVVCSDSFEPSGQFVPNLNYTVHWQTNHSRLENWKDITNKFQRVKIDRSKTFLNVSNNITTEEPCDYGNDYNPIQREITYQICDEYEEMECVNYISNTSVVCFDSYEQNENDYTIFWKDISSKLDKINYDYQGMDSWYYLKNVSINSEQNYQIRMWVDMPISLDGVSGKYFWAVKPSSKTIQEALNTNTFYALDPWFNSSWTYKKNITIDYTKVNGSQVNFPVLINLTDTDLKDDAQADGDDIVFTDSDNSQLDHEIEFYNGTTGFLVAWVRIPTLSNTTNTTIQMYYGNAGASNQENVSGVWDDNFVMVQHLSETPTAYMNDSTSNDNDGTTSGMDSADQVAGQIDGSLDFDGGDDYVETVSISHNIGIGEFTYTAWINWNTDSAWNTILSNANYAPSFGILSGGAGTLGVYWGGDKNSGATITAGQLTYVTVLRKGNLLKFYINGSQTPNTIDVTGRSISNDNNRIGWSNYGDEFFNGTIDEARISNVTRLAGWIATEYNNQYSPDSFYSVGGEETESAEDTTDPTYSNIAHNTTIAGTSINFSIDWNDNSALNPNGQYIFSTNNTGSWVNETTNFTSTPQSVSVVKTLNLTVGISIGYRWYGSDNASNSADTGIQSFITTGADTCTYTSNNWEVDCSDNCVITENVDVGGNNISITGTGTFKINGGNVSNYEELFIKGTDESNICEVYCYGGCFG